MSSCPTYNYLGIIGLLLLSACAMQPEDPVPVAHVESRHALHTVVFDGDDGSLPASERLVLQHFLDTVPVLAAEEVILETSQAAPNVANRIGGIKDILGHAGFTQDVVHLAANPLIAPDEMNIIIHYHVAGVACPGWWRDPTSNHRNARVTNAGCATARNLAAMVADPKDLLRGQKDFRPDAERTSRVVQTYRGTPASNGNASSTNAGGSTATSQGDATSDNAGTEAQ